MRIPKSEFPAKARNSRKHPGAAIAITKARVERRFTRCTLAFARVFAAILVCSLTVALFLVARTGAQGASSGQPWHLPDIPWAFPVRDPKPPEIDNRSGPIHVPGSKKTYTQEQIDDIKNPPDWFPDEHAPMPRVVAHGADGGVLGCASCHLASGLGHPESSDLAGQSAEYIERQLGDFKAERRMGEAMNDMARNLSDEDAKAAAHWFEKLRPQVWNKVIETDTVPQTFVNEHLMRMPLPGGHPEAIGDRIIELPQDVPRAESRDPHSGFVAYVPKGSISKGKEFVSTGGGGKTIQCMICHGPTLGGLGEVPAIAGHDPMYLFRQLYYFKDGSRHGSMGALMKGVVAQMTPDDMLAIAAYLGSLPPGTEEDPSNNPSN